MKLEEMMLEHWLQWQLDALTLWVSLVRLGDNFVWIAEPEVQQLCEKLKSR